MAKGSLYGWWLGRFVILRVLGCYNGRWLEFWSGKEKAGNELLFCPWTTESIVNQNLKFAAVLVLSNKSAHSCIDLSLIFVYCWVTFSINYATTANITPFYLCIYIYIYNAVATLCQSECLHFHIASLDVTPFDLEPRGVKLGVIALMVLENFRRRTTLVAR